MVAAVACNLTSSIFGHALLKIVIATFDETVISALLIICLTHANVWESVGKPCSCMQFIKSCIFYCKSRKIPYQYYKSHENPYQVLQVTHTESEHAMKSKVRMIKSLSP